MKSLDLHWSAVRQSYVEARAAERTKRTRGWLEPEFLPAALEVVDRPVSPTARITAWLLMVMVLSAALWMAFGRLDVVASAPGELLPIDNVKVVQAPYGGTVRAILVADGDTVKRGQALVELDPTMANADEAEARKALMAAQLDVARNQAIVDGLSGKGIVVIAPPDTPADMVATQQRLATTIVAAHHAEQRQLAASRASAMLDMDAAVKTMNTYDATAPMLDKQVAAVQTLAEKGYASRFRVLELQRQQKTEQGNRGVAAVQVARSRSESVKFAQAAVQSNEQALQSALQALAAAQNEVQAKEQAFARSRQQQRMQRLVAPADGTVQQLSVHTVGGVVEAARPLMVIVPEGALAMKAKLLNREAGFVRPGHKVAMKLDAFPFTRYGTVPGRIMSISRSAVQEGDKPAVYVAHIALDRQYIQVGEKRVSLRPGLSGTADIQTGDRSMLSYLLDPVTGALSEAGRER